MRKQKRKVCVVSGSRAEYGLLYWTLMGLSDDPEIILQIIVTGMHLSPEFGLTYKSIEDDGFTINKKLDILLSSDSSTGVSKSVGLACISFADAFEELKPDILLILGDRFEILAAAIAALIAKIPIAHCHGGEITMGAYDDAFRHSITKMSHVHFTATDEYRDRVIRLGENPKHVFNVGGLGIENINRLKLLSKDIFEKEIGFKLRDRNLLVTFHPETLNVTQSSEDQFDALLKVLNEFKDVGMIFTLPNADNEGRSIIRMIENFVSANKNAISFKSMGQLKYLSALQYVHGIVGNSSSGIIEAPSFKIGTINIGDRQKGRLKANSIIDCRPEYYSIKEAFSILFSDSFQSSLKNTINPYDSGNSSVKIVDTIKSISLNNLLIKSPF